MQVYAHTPRSAHFENAKACFDCLADRLADDASLSLPHDAVEEFLQHEGRELLRRLFQDHLDLRSSKEIRRTEVTGPDGVARTHGRRRQRALESVFGRVTVDRFAYSQRGLSSVAPLDEALNLPNELYSYGVRQRAAVEASKGSFDEAVRALDKTTGAHVAKRQLEQLTQRAAQDFDAFYEQRTVVSAPPSDLLVLSFDCKGIVMRTQDLRDEARRDAEKSKTTRRFNKRKTRGQVRGNKRMAQLATVYDVAPFVRDIKDVMAGFRPLRIIKERPRPYNKRVWASIDKEGEDVIDEAFREALRRDPYKQRQWVVTIDGDLKQLRKLNRVVARHRVDVMIVLDIVHVLEYLWTAATCFHGEFAPQREAWVTERFRRILEGKASTVAGGLRRSATLRGLKGTRRKRIDVTARYLLQNTSRLRYADYLAAGAPIGTGVIEGACRHLVKDRFDITGARWSLGGAEALLRVRALRISGDFEEYWRYHVAMQRQRKYSCRNVSGCECVVTDPLSSALETPREVRDL